MAGVDHAPEMKVTQLHNHFVFEITAYSMCAGNVHQTSLAAACVVLIHPFIVFIETKCFYNFGYFFSSHFIVKWLLRSVSGKI